MMRLRLSVLMDDDIKTGSSKEAELELLALVIKPLNAIKLLQSRLTQLLRSSSVWIHGARQKRYDPALRVAAQGFGSLVA